MIINGVGEKISPSLLLLLFPIKRTAEKKTAYQSRSRPGLSVALNNLLHGSKNVQGQGKTLDHMIINKN